MACLGWKLKEDQLGEKKTWKVFLVFQIVCSGLFCVGLFGLQIQFHQVFVQVLSVGCFKSLAGRTQGPCLPCKSWELQKLTAQPGVLSITADPQGGTNQPKKGQSKLMMETKLNGCFPK